MASQERVVCCLSRRHPRTPLTATTLTQHVPIIFIARIDEGNGGPQPARVRPTRRNARYRSPRRPALAIGGHRTGPSARRCRDTMKPEVVCLVPLGRMPENHISELSWTLCASAQLPAGTATCVMLSEVPARP